MSFSTDGWDWVGVPREMTPDGAALLTTIADAGDDDTPRLVYADYLEEIGKTDWAAFVRRQCADLNKCEGVRPCKLASPFPMGYSGASNNVEKTTVEKLFLAGPWLCGGYTHRYRDQRNNLAAFEVMSTGYRNKSLTIYPRFMWYRGFLSAFFHVSARNVFKFAQSGAHAWHPWDAMSDCLDPGAEGFVQHFFRCGINAEFQYDDTRSTRPEFRRHALAAPYYITVARRSATARKWEIRDAEYTGFTVNNLEVVPEPITRFLECKDTDSQSRPNRYYYQSYPQANDDLNRAVRLFLCEAAKQARARVRG